MRLAFIAFPYYRTFARFAKFDESLVLAAAFAARGVTLDIVDGPGSTADWQRYDAVLPLGCWGYHQDEAAWRAWIAELESRQVRLVNAPEILRWNTDKSYLLDLQAAGVQVAPLLHFPMGTSPDLAAEISRAGWSRYVLKPTISANSLRTIVASGTPDQEVRALAKEILSSSGLLLQPFFEEIPQQGEWSLMFFGDTLSHSVIKVPKAGDFRSQPDYGATVRSADPPADVVQQAAAALAVAPARPAYARVDGFLRDGQLQLVELELIEPFLFLDSADQDAAGRFCDALLTYLR